MVPEPFDPVTRGDPNGRYVFGIDPASEQDNFALIIIEIHPQHQRIVYSWTTNKKISKVVVASVLRILMTTMASAVEKFAIYTKYSHACE